VHIGTHRTATTSLQRTFSRHSEDLESHHCIYPRAGRPPEAPYGHHNIAWELSGDRRFRPGPGSIADLLAEIRDSCHDVLLSSEDFHCSVFDADGFEAFVRLLRANQLAVRVVVYLRNQVDYVQSLYPTLLLFDLPDTFDEFLRTILEDGRFCWKEWMFPICYRSLLTRLEAIEDMTVEVRSYDRPAHGSVIGDFFSILGLNPEALGVDSSVRSNGRDDLPRSAKLFCQNGKGTPLDGLEQRIVDCLCDSIETRPLRMSAASGFRIADRFRESNEYVRSRYGIDLTSAAETAAKMGELDAASTLEAIFSARFRRSVEGLANLFRAG
jgi:hypothetical protein